MASNELFGDLAQSTPSPAGSSKLFGDLAPSVPAGGHFIGQSLAVQEMQASIYSLLDQIKKYPDFYAFLLRSGYLQHAITISLVRAGTNGKPDGRWGQHTDMALQAIKTLAYALVKIQAAMHLGGDSGSSADAFAQSISNGYKDLTNPTAMANVLKPGIDQIITFYDQIADKMTKHYAPQMQSTYNIATHNSGVDAIPTDWAQSVIPGVYDRNRNRIMLGDIATPEAFASYLEKVGIEPTQQNIIQQAQHLKSILAGQKPTTPSLEEGATVL